MGKKNKLGKFADILSYPNVVECYDMDQQNLIAAPGKEVDLRGRWNSDFFPVNRPICVELACGKGDYSLGLAKLDGSKNYLGVDIKGNRIWKGATRALEGNLENVGFLRTRIERITNFFDPGEMHEIWITFPDPFPRKSKVNRRLTSHFFLDKYTYLLNSGCKVHLKTDAQDLFAFSLESIESHPSFELEEVVPNVYELEEIPDYLKIQTFYEKMHLEDGRTISYLRARRG